MGIHCRGKESLGTARLTTLLGVKVQLAEIEHTSSPDTDVGVVHAMAAPRKAPPTLAHVARAQRWKEKL